MTTGPRVTTENMLWWVERESQSNTAAAIALKPTGDLLQQFIDRGHRLERIRLYLVKRQMRNRKEK